MSKDQNRPAWMEDASVKDIPREKLDFLCALFEEANKKKKGGDKLTQKEMLLRFMPLLKQAKTSNLQLTPQELQAAVAAIKKHSAPEELSEIERVLSGQKGGGI